MNEVLGIKKKQNNYIVGYLTKPLRLEIDFDGTENGLLK